MIELNLIYIDFNEFLQYLTDLDIKYEILDARLNVISINEQDFNLLRLLQKYYITEAMYDRLQNRFCYYVAYNKIDP